MKYRQWKVAIASVVATTIMLAAMLAAVVLRQHRRQDMRDDIGSKLRFFLIGIDSYNRLYETFPPSAVTSEDGIPLYSWRLPVLPLTGNLQPPYGFETDRAWTWAGHRRIREELITRYQRAFYDSGAVNRHDTIFMGVIGPETVFDEANANRHVALPDDVIVLIEVYDSGVHWMEPRDLEIESLRARDGTAADANLGDPADGTVWVGFKDLNVWLLRDDIPMDKLLPFCTVDGAERHDRGIDLAPYRVENRISTLYDR